MIKLLGLEYITDKEASLKYGFSQDWFKKVRVQKRGPKYIKLEGKVLYPVHDTDEWFRKNIKSSEDNI